MKGRAAWASVGALMLAMIAVMLWQWPSSSSEWASWAQAIGTVAALVGVMWIAHADERRNREEQLASAAVAAAVQLRSLPELIAVVDSIHKYLGQDEPKVSGIRQMEVTLETMNRLTLPTEGQMLSLLPLGQQFSMTFAHAIGQIGQARALASLATWHPPGPDEPDELTGTVTVHRILGPVLNDLRACLLGLIRFNDSEVAKHWAASRSMPDTANQTKEDA